MAREYYSRGIRLALLGLCLRFAAAAWSSALDVLRVVFVDPLRWLFWPDEMVALELRGLEADANKLESRRLERDKPRRAFMARWIEHPKAPRGHWLVPA